MILFQKDWNQSGAIPDLDTSNKSFLHYVGVLKEMGVKNHLWPLQLYDTSLIGVDPHSPDLTNAQMLKIAAESRANLFYYLREVVRVPVSGSPDPIPFIANRGNMCLMWCFLNHITILLEMIRQSGKSVSSDVLKTWIVNSRSYKVTINLLTKDEKLKAKNLATIKDILQSLPPYMRNLKRKDIANSDVIHISNRDNRIIGHLPQSSPKLALNVGRGFTSPIFFGDEVAFLANIGISLPAALAAGVHARDQARANNEVYGTVLTTTAGKKDDRDGEYIYKKLRSQYASWSESFMDCTDEEHLKKCILSASRSSVKDTPMGQPKLGISASFLHRQLGFTDAWLRRAISETEVSGDDANRDFFGVWTSGSSKSPFSPEDADRIRNSESTSFYGEIDPNKNYMVRWYIPQNQITTFMSQNKTILSIDTSEAIGQDDIFLSIRDVKTGGIVAASNINESNINSFSIWLYEFIIKRFHQNLTTIIERRSTGSTVIDILIELMIADNLDPFKLLYNRVIQDREEFPDRFNEINKAMYLRHPEVYIKHRKQFGFATSASGYASRKELYSTTLMNSVRYTAHNVHDKKIIDQLLALTVENGRVDHSAGEHDDGCISWLLSYWLMTKGKNLQYYGISPSMVLSVNQTLKEERTPEKLIESKEQYELRQQITQLSEQLKRTKDPFLTYKLESRLINISKRLILKQGERFSIDDLIKEIRDSKNKPHSR